MTKNDSYFPAFQSHSETSHDAAEAIRPNAGTLRRKILDLLTVKSYNPMDINGEYDPGLTDEEMQSATMMNPSTQRPRRIELQRMGLIQDSGRKRATKSGRKAVVWELVAREK